MAYFFLLAGAFLLFWGLWQIRREVREEAREAAGVVDELIVAGQHLLDQIDQRKRELDELRATDPGRCAGRSLVPAADAGMSGEGVVDKAPAPVKEKAQVRPTAGLREKVWTLADTGLSPPEIARRLGSSKGEVELALRLRQVR